MSREFVDSLAVADNLEAEKAFKDSMTNKVGDSLEIKRKEISKTFVASATGDAVPVTTDQEVEAYEESA